MSSVVALSGSEFRKSLVFVPYEIFKLVRFLVLMPKLTLMEVLSDLRLADCDLLTMGQYLMPSRRSIQGREYIGPEVFERYRGEALGRIARARAHAEFSIETMAQRYRRLYLHRPE